MSGYGRQLQIRGMDNPSAIREADVVVLCVPFETVLSVTGDLFDVYSDKIVVSPVVPMACSKYFEYIPPAEGCAAKLVKNSLPETVRVVSAFHTIPAASLQEIDREERISIILLERVRDRIRNFYSRFSTRADKEALRREVTEEMKTKKYIREDIPVQLFNETIFTINKEIMYLQTLLPTIISERNMALREDFLENCGMDRFYVEELEREYYEKNGLDLEDLYKIRKGLN